MVDIYKNSDFQCTCFFNGWWLKSCLIHDWECADAQAQESLSLRLEADLHLRINVSNSGTTELQKLLSPIIANIMYFGVSIFRIVVCKWIRGYK